MKTRLLLLCAAFLFVLAIASAAAGDFASQREEDALRRQLAEAQAQIAALSTQPPVMRVSQHSDFASYTTLITTAGGFLTLIATLLWQGYTQARNHKWEAEATMAHRRMEIARIGEVQQKIASVGLQIADRFPRSVLLVDDDPDVTPLVQAAVDLCHAPVTLFSAADGTSALRELRLQKFDVLILDMTLPVGGPSGMDVLLAAKAFTSLPVLILTADETAETFVRSLNSGALDVMVKPFALDALAIRIQCVLDALDRMEAKKC